jgi:hypothetical protein
VEKIIDREEQKKLRTYYNKRFCHILKRIRQIGFKAYFECHSKKYSPKRILYYIRKYNLYTPKMKELVFIIDNNINNKRKNHGKNR